MYENGLIKKLRLISEFTTLQKEIIKIQILSNILRTKGNKAMKFGQLIECFSSKFMLKFNFYKRVWD